MCAQYGLGGGPTDDPLPDDLPPLDDHVVHAEVARWAREHKNRARITGAKALNLNPLIVAEGTGRAVKFAWWWLWPSASGPAHFSAFNARDDKLTTSWRTYLGQRALIPATWYIEKGRVFHLPDHQTFAIAAITNTVVDAGGAPLLTYAMVTRSSVAQASTVHPRMPLILPCEAHDDWLDPAVPGDEDLVRWAVNASGTLSTTVQLLSRQTPKPEEGLQDQPMPLF